MNILKKIMVAAIIIPAVIAVTGFFIAPVVLKSVLIKNISDVTHRSASIEKIAINPFTLSATLSGFKLADPGKASPFFSFETLYINVGATMSIFRRALILDEIRMEKPSIDITRKLDGTYNFTDLLPKEEAKKEEAKPFLFSFNNIRMTGGRIDFHDLPRKTDHTVRDLKLSVPFVSNIEYYIKEYVEPTFSARVNGRLLSAVGKTTPFEKSRATHFDIHLTDVDIPRYLQYVPVKLNFKPVSAGLDAHLKITFLIHNDKSSLLTVTGNAALKNVALDDLQGNKLLRLPLLAVHIASVEPFTPKVHLSNVTLEAPELVVKRSKTGEINLANLAQPQPQGESAPPEDKAKQQPPSAIRKEDKKTLNLRIDHLLIDKADVLFADNRPDRPVKIHIAPLRLDVSKFSLAPGENAAVDLAFLVDPKAEITVKGEAGMNPLHADLALHIAHLAIHPFQPYFTESVQMDVTRGYVETNGTFNLRMDKQDKPVMKYAGDLAVLQLASIDRIHAQDFLKFKKLSFTSLDAGYNPLFVNVREISASDFFAKIVINDGGTTNIQDIFSPPQKDQESTQAAAEKESDSAKSAKAKEPPPDIKIGKVNFSGGKVIFADRNIKPNYGATLLNLKGAVTGLSSQEFSRAKVDLKGNLGYGSPVIIAGAINPLIKDRFADMKIRFKDIEMSPVTPYAIKFLGYPITKGKLTFDVSYLIDKRKLRAENKVFFDQLTFGEKVDSPDAIKAPVTLAVTLLTDRNGQINLDIPLSGSLDDPQFKIWPIVWQILKNLITKAVTAPFALLSSVTGGGEEMSYVEFEPGSSQLAEAEIKKIKALAKALLDRPNIKVDIEGYVDPATDREALKTVQFNNLLKAQKLKETLAGEESSATLKDIVINRNEYEKYLTLAYKAADFPKPRTALGLLKTLPPKDMEKLLQDHIAVTDNDLMQLAARRGQTVRTQLLQGNNIEAARLFLVKPASPAPEKKDKVKDSRVNFKLK